MTTGPLIQLVTRPDLGVVPDDDASSVDLYAWLAGDGWTPVVSDDGNPADEVLTLNIPGTSIDDMIANVHLLDAKLKETRWAQSVLQPNGVWLRVQLAGETNARQSFLTGGKRSPGAAVNDIFLKEQFVKAYQLGLTRVANWEADAPVTIAPAGAISIHGGVVPYTVAGDASARVAQVQVYGGVYNGGKYDELWLGVKSDQYGCNPTNFVPVWRLDSGPYVDTTVVHDTDSLFSHNLSCNFGVYPTMIYRSLTWLSAITANLSDQCGKYNVLLRAKTSLGSTLIANVRLGGGYMDSVGGLNSFSFGPRVQIKEAFIGWRYYALGQVSLPPTSVFFAEAFTGAALAIQAEKVSGNGSLEMDCLILVPAEHSFHAAAPARGFGPTGYAGSYQYLYAFTRPDGRQSALTYDTSSNSTLESISPDVSDWAIPPGSGVIVCVASHMATMVADTLTPAFQVYPAYASLRGVD